MVKIGCAIAVMAHRTVADAMVRMAIIVWIRRIMQASFIPIDDAGVVMEARGGFISATGRGVG